MSLLETATRDEAANPCAATADADQRRKKVVSHWKKGWAAENHVCDNTAMRNLFNPTQKIRIHPAVTKFILVLGILWLGLQSRALAVESPRGKEVFSGVQPMAIVPPKIIRVIWNYPANLETSDLVFKLYGSADLNVPMRQWSLRTNIPGNVRFIRLTVDKTSDFFVLTASNSFGESRYATW